MRKFDYSFLDNELLPANLINLTGAMVREGKIQIIGSGKNTKYIKYKK